MAHRSHSFYDIRFGILVAIIASILLFKYCSVQPPKAGPATSSPASQGDTTRAGMR